MPRTQSHTRMAKATALSNESQRRGVEGWCVACRLPVTKGHIDAKGHWLGCQSTNVPADTPFILIPDRRFFRDRRVTPKPSEGEVAINGGRSERRMDTASAAIVDASPAVAQPKPIGKPRGLQGPQVLYVARYPVTDSGVENLPEHDRKVYELIAETASKGATRKHLLEATGGLKLTGRTDGAIRRMRLKKLIEAKPFSQ